MPTNVGSVVASIVPDVSDFASRATAALTPQADRLGQNLGRSLSRSMTRALDFSGIDNALRRSLDVAEASAANKGRQIGRRYGQAMRAGLDSELRGLGTLDVTIRPVIDRTAYRAVQADLDVLTRARTVSIRADVDTRTGADDLALLTRARSVTINANADTTAAAQLALLARNRTATVNANVNSSQIGQATSLVSRLTSGFSAAGGAVSFLWNKWTLLAGGIPIAGSLANAVAAIAPAAALAVPAVAALGSAVGAIKLGTSGLGDAFKEAFGSASSGASGAASATHQVEQAQRRLADAQRAVGDAQRQAAEQVAQAQEAVANAQRDLTAAQKDAMQAQQDLTQAYEDGRRALQDMNLQLSGAKLDEEEAILRVKQAQEDLNKTLANPKASELDREEAKLRLKEAQQGLKEQQVETRRLEEDTKKANKAGVEGTNQVKSAKESLAQANQNVTDKTKAVKDAEDAVTKARVDGARSVADAQRSVADATQALADAQAASAAQTAKLTQNFAKLSPNAKGFVNAVKGLKPAWDSMQLGVQDRLFAGIGSRLSNVGSRVIPILRGGLEGTAGVLNRVGKNALDAVNNLAKTGMLKKILDGATASLKPLEKAPSQIITAFGQIAVAAGPSFQKVTEGLGGIITKVTDKLGKAFESGAMEKAIDQAVSLLGDLMDVGKNVFSILGDIFMAGAQSGGGTIGMLKTITSEIAKIASSPEVQGGLKALFSVMGTIAKTVAPLLGTSLKFVGQIFEKLGPPVEILVKALGDALKPVIDALGPVLVILADVLGKVLVAISPLLPVIGQLIATALKPLGPVLKVVGDLIEHLVPVIKIWGDTLGKQLTPILEGLGAVLIELAQQYAPVFIQVLNELLPVLPQLIPPLIDIGKQLGNLLLAIAPLLPQILLLTAKLVVALLPTLIPLVPPLVKLTDLLVRLAVWGIEKFALPAIQGLVKFIADMKRKFQPFIDATTHVVKMVIDGFQHLYDVLVGHSIIPDLIKKIRDWFETGKRWAKEKWDALWAATIGKATSAAKTVGDKVSGFAGGVGDKFGDAKRWASGKWSDLWSGVSGTTSSWRKTVEGKVGDFKDNVVGFFKKAVDGVKTAWDKLRTVSKDPVKFLIKTVFNDGLRAVWNNTAAKLPGIKTIPAMALPKGFATGGILPGYTPGRDVHRFVSPTGGMLDLSGGEAIMRPEVTRAVGRGGIDALNAAARQGGVAGVQALLAQGLPRRAFWGGGIWDALKDNPVSNTIKKVAGKGSSLLDKAADWARGGVADLAEKTLKTLLGVSSLAIDTKNQIWSKLVGNVPVQLAAKMVGWLRGQEDAGAGSSVALKGYKPSAGVKQWTSVVLQALKEVGQPASLLGSTLRRMQQESGGNPTIVNKWDSNWQAGHPSVGLMQVIGPTFRSYAGKYRNKGPFLYGTSVDPLANVYSSMKYALGAYGSLSRAYDRAGGYAKGGSPKAGEWAWVGEEGPELVRFKQPAQVYPHQESMRIAQRMAAAQASMNPASRGDVHHHYEANVNANVTDKPTRQTVMNALRDTAALYSSSLAF
ncbi:transglycosylase SLT domain-containing protein [Streptomyces sp. NPDC052207]|uniref:transglycosylase SLT domain-containing protein n=1 Tax=Streptomyces sp. NPDC052207 TaxID=3155418 RepID=UPI0034120D58